MNNPVFVGGLSSIFESRYLSKIWKQNTESLFLKWAAEILNIQWAGKKLECDKSLKSILELLFRWLSDEGCIYTPVFPNFEEFNLATITTTTVLIEGL